MVLPLNRVAGSALVTTFNSSASATLKMSIKQFNASYLVNEDRILFRFNTHDEAEYRLWFTRRVTLFILVATARLIAKKLEKTHSSDAAKALTEFEKEAALQSPEDKKEVPQLFESGTQFPIGAEALLVMDVSCSLTKNDEKLAYIQSAKEGQIDDDALSIDFLLPGGANLNLKLPENLLKNVCALLDKLRLSAGWGEAVLQEKISEKNNQHLDLKASSNQSIH